MKRVFLCALACLAWAVSAGATEVTFFRPRGFIGDDWTYYVMLGAKPLADLQAGERVTLEVPAGTRSLAIDCPKAGGSSYTRTAIAQELREKPAYFELSANYNCVAIEARDATAAARLRSRTLPRPADRPIDYAANPVEPSAAVATAAQTPEPVLAPVASAAPAAQAASGDPVAAATAAWLEAFNSRDAARLSALYDPQAVLSDATEPRQRVGAAAIADYYKSVAERPTQRAALGEHNARSFGDTGVDSGTINFFEMRNGQAVLTPARYTLVYRKRGNSWVIVDHQVAPASH